MAKSKPHVECSQAELLQAISASLQQLTEDNRKLQRRLFGDLSNFGEIAQLKLEIKSLFNEIGKLELAVHNLQQKRAGNGKST